jgi:hypothetical protein
LLLINALLSLNSLEYVEVDFPIDFRLGTTTTTS